MPATKTSPEVIIRPLAERDLGAADRIMRLAFGTFLGIPDPMRFMGDADYAHSRRRANPSAAFAAELAGELVGSNFVANWGSVGYFGPLTVHPNFWDRGIAKRLLEATMELFEKWGTRHRGLYTFPHSPKHIALYQKFGFWPRSLTAIMTKEIPPIRKGTEGSSGSEAPAMLPENCLAECREITNAI